MTLPRTASRSCISVQLQSSPVRRRADGRRSRRRWNPQSTDSRQHQQHARYSGAESGDRHQQGRDIRHRAGHHVRPRVHRVRHV